MNTFTQKLEDRLVPIAVKLNENRYLTAIKEGFIGVMSFLIIGSMFLLIANLPIPGFKPFMDGIFGEGWKTFITVPFNATMNILTIFVVLGISKSLSNHYKIYDLSSQITTLVGFFIITPFLDGESGAGIPTRALGAEGLFVGIIVAILTVEIINFVLKRGWSIKMPETVPENVARSFTALIPGTLVIVFFLIIRLLFSLTDFGTFQNFIFSILQLPLMNLGGTLIARIIVTMFEQVLWLFGLHGPNIAGSVMTPIYNALTVQNAEAFLNGLQPMNMMTNQFHANFVKIGGSGGTLGLVLIMMFKSKSEQFKQLGKLSFAPGLFNINEPIIFGLPIVLNPIMAIPFIIAPLVMTLVTYFAMSTGLVPLTSGIDIPWTTPAIFSGLLVTGWRGAVLQVVNILISIGIYYPFFKAVDEMAYQEELGNNADGSES